MRSTSLSTMAQSSSVLMRLASQVSVNPFGMVVASR